MSLVKTGRRESDLAELFGGAVGRAWRGKINSSRRPEGHLTGEVEGEKRAKEYSNSALQCVHCSSIPVNDRSTTFAHSLDVVLPTERLHRVPHHRVVTGFCARCHLGGGASQRVSVSSSAKDAMSLSSISFASYQRVPVPQLAAQR